MKVFIILTSIVILLSIGLLLFIILNHDHHHHQIRFLNNTDINRAIENFNNNDSNRASTVVRKRRIVGGHPVNIQSFPWTAMVMDKGRCGGVLIDRQWILTAGHCIVSRKPIAYFGVDNLSSSLSMRKAIKRDISQIYKPVRFFTTGDIALLKLSYPIQKSESVRPIRMNSQSIRGNFMTYNNRKCYMAGFGRNVGKNNHLLAGLFDLQPVYRFSSRDIIGAKSESFSPCYGDSGSGLIIDNNNNEPILIGITSSILKATCETNSLALFTDVAFYYKWIMAKMGLQSSSNGHDNDDQDNYIDPNEIDYNNDNNNQNNIPYDHNEEQEENDARSIIPMPIPPPPPPTLPPALFPAPAPGSPHNFPHSLPKANQKCWPSIPIPWTNYKISVCNTIDEIMRIIY